MRYFIGLIFTAIVLSGCGNRLAKPSNLSAVALNDSTINLTWIPLATGQEGYQILQSIDSARFTQIMRVEQDARSVTLKKLKGGTNYRFKLIAFAGEDVGEPSEIVEVTTPMTVPLPPTNLTCEAIASTMIRVSWEDNSTCEEGYIVEHKADLENEWTEIIRTPPNWTEIIDSDLKSGSIYAYRIQAFTPHYVSDFTPVVTAITNSFKSVHVLSPNGGEVVNGSKIVVRWDSDPDILFVKVKIYNAEGFGMDLQDMVYNSTSKAYAGMKSGMVLADLRSVGEYIFDEVYGLPNSKTYKIRVLNPKTGRFDDSDAYFEVRSGVQ